MSRRPLLDAQDRRVVGMACVLLLALLLLAAALGAAVRVFLLAAGL